MFDPDLGYYVRALRAGARILATGLLVGAIAGLLIGVIRTGRDWEVSQVLRVDTAAVSPAIDDRGFLSLPELPDLKVLDEAAFARVVTATLDLPSSTTISIVPDDAAGSLRVFASAGSRAQATRDLQRVLDAYQKARKDDFDRRLSADLDAVTAQQRSSEESLTQIDAQIAGTSADDVVLAQALVAQRAQISDLLQSAVGARTYLEGFRQSQTGGLTLVGDPEFKQQPPTGSGVTLAIVLGLVGIVVAGVIVLLRRMFRRRIESAADLALFSSIVSVGDLERADDHVYDRLAAGAGSDGSPAKIIVTESLVGQAGSTLEASLLAHDINAELHPCLHLPSLAAEDRLVIAVDRRADNEQSVDDLLELIRGAAPRPVLAVLC